MQERKEALQRERMKRDLESGAISCTDKNLADNGEDSAGGTEKTASTEPESSP